MNPENVKDYFEKPQVVCDYAEATINVGLWNSEKIVFEKFIPKTAKILELGCGAGRIAFGLHKLGYTNLTATDFSSGMVLAARQIFESNNANIDCFELDAVEPNLPKESFDAVIFGFNGLMQIPSETRRKKAITEIFSLLKSGGIFAFTTHDRDAAANADYWANEKKRWENGVQQPILDEFGDIYYCGAHGNIYIHSPVKSQVEEALNEAGFVLSYCEFRRNISPESEAVEDFSDDCIFWVAKKK